MDPSRDISENLILLKSQKPVNIELEHLGKLQATSSVYTDDIQSEFNGKINSKHVVPCLRKHVKFPSDKKSKKRQEPHVEFSVFQEELLSILDSYHDFYFTSRTWENAEEIRNTYCLHVLNHILKSRALIEANDEKIKQGETGEFRDQGFTKCRVLILVPFRSGVSSIIMAFCNLLFPPGEANLDQSERFIADYFSEDVPKTQHKDYLETFSGHTNDCFQIGFAIKSDGIKPYTGFYDSDLIIASPLGLRQQGGNSDFLSSIEMVILDQVDVLHMQNWLHVLDILGSLHKNPKDLHRANITRIRMANLNGLAKHFNQLIVFSAVPHPVINGVFNKFHSSYTGQIKQVQSSESRILPDVREKLSHGKGQMSHVFHKFEAKSVGDIPDARFNSFVSEVFPWYKERGLTHTVLFIPSTFDYIRIRNYFQQMDIPCSKMSENTDEKALAKEKVSFYEGSSEIILVTERYYFFNRTRLKSVQHLIFYEPPVHPQFYQEFCAMAIHTAREIDHEITCTTMCCQYDGQPVANIVGTQLSKEIMHSKKLRYVAE